MPKKYRKISLGIKIINAGTSRNVIDDLLSAVKAGSRTGDYTPPNQIVAMIYWTNPPGPRKFDEFSNAMAESAESSIGFDKLVTNHLNKKRERRQRRLEQLILERRRDR